ncbi:acyloxyacyl hydrolase [Flavihumibacter profundi]|uniref:acyloxyacyl hydrolase n=1 Tax=Flavihumibacter profundi TaxID=2716883 RepID=UPI001CC38712|nr:acyloxyacyl hydrolase [Flavihumibacter profundi]MBZ5855628.1 acyloxyacyl hydrolase [Flavihumibacter profundi]
MFLRSRVIFILCLFLSFNVSAQSDSTVSTDPNYGTFRFFSIKLHAGKNFYTGASLTNELKHGYGAIELRTGWQSKGKKHWENQYNYPAYGIGWYTGYVGDVDIFGQPNALFGFITFPITRGKLNSFHIEPALGFTFNLKPYNRDHNSINDAIGSKFAIYFSLHGGGQYRLNREVDLLYGIDFTHFSNGRTVTPNLGLNMAGFSLGALYNFNGTQHKVDNSEHPKTILEARPTFGKTAGPDKIRENNVSLYQAIGTVQNKDDAGTTHSYLTSSTVLEYQHKFNTMHGISFGFDAFIDPSARDTAEYPLNKEKMETFFPSVHVGYDFMFWRLTVRLQIGYNLTTIGRELKGNTFMRPALRYEFTKRFYGQVGLKTMNGATADWIEFGAGYKLFYRRHSLD